MYEAQMRAAGVEDEDIKRINVQHNLECHMRCVLWRRATSGGGGRDVPEGAAMGGERVKNDDHRGFFFSFPGLHLQHMEVCRVGV